MSKIHPVNSYYRTHGLVNEQAYLDLYKRSVEDNEGFWADEAKRVDWIKPFTQVKDVSFDKDDLHIRWYEMAR